MNSAEGYPGYRSKEDFKAGDIYPSLTRFLLIYIGVMEIIFGVFTFISASQKSILSIPFIFFVLLSLSGGISFMIIARKQNMKRIGNLLKIGFIVGLIVGIFYFYIIIKALPQV